MSSSNGSESSTPQAPTSRVSTARTSRQDGVRVRDSGAVTITGNAIRDNTEYGIRLESSVVENRATLTDDNVLSGNGSGAVSEE